MIYTITALIFLIISLIIWDNQKIGNRLLVLAVIWLIIFDGFRWEIGTDWEPYYEFFLYGDNEHMGLSYSWLNVFFRQFTNNYTIITLFVAVIIYVTLFFLSQKYSPAPIMSILIFYCSMMGTLGCNRQFVAMTICIGSLYFIFRRKLLLFLLTITLAASFHITSLIFIPAYFLYGKSVSSRSIMVFVVGAFLMSLTKIVNKIPFVEYLAMIDSVTSGSTNLQSYFDSYTGNVSFIGSLKRILFIFFALQVRNKINNPNYAFFLFLYAVGTIIYLLFNGSVLQIVAGRGAAYYNVFECIVIPFVVLNCPLPKNIRKIVWIGFFLMYVYLMWRDMNSYYILDGVDIFNPYKNVLL